MSEEEFSPIRPRAVPLSHVQQPAAPQTAQPRTLPWKPILLTTSVIALLLLVFLVIPDLVRPPAVTRHTAAEPVASGAASESRGSSAGAESAAPPPFEALLRQQTREKAQAELSRFVELQMRLENSMQVGTWGKADLDAAKGLATRGDEQFLAEKFEESLDSYRAASDALEALIATGEQLLAEALTRGNKALDNRDQRAALAGFQQALTIDPDNETAQTGLARANLLPEVVDLMREAKNHELAGDFRAALATDRKSVV